MMDQKLLEVLVCPVTKQKLQFGKSEQVQQLNKQISRGSVKTIGGSLVCRQIEGALVREDGLVAYCIVDGIPNMLAEDGIAIIKE